MLLVDLSFLFSSVTTEGLHDSGRGNDFLTPMSVGTDGSSGRSMTSPMALSPHQSPDSRRDKVLEKKPTVAGVIMEEEVNGEVDGGVAVVNHDDGFDHGDDIKHVDTSGEETDSDEEDDDVDAYIMDIAADRGPPVFRPKPFSFIPSEFDMK